MEASPCISPQLLAAIARCSVLIICAIAGLICIYLGWRLYKDAILSYTESEAKTSSFSIKIVSAGPGVFFAAFGMWLLVSLVNRPYQATVDYTPPSIQAPASVLMLPANHGEHGQLLRTSESRGSDTKKDCQNILVFFDGQRIDRQAISQALQLAIRDMSKGDPTEKVSGLTVNRNQAINILSKLNSLGDQDDAL
ncbi:hypothetical protein [Pseudomonas sichuanensis]|uniref:hypothetical protein n=1 Tax=Pseudomonas sichuanensis TaxID=2213015 RepID=UPI0013008F64|nr:hypothetical protein [Pseudomonas sichuanensis]